MKICVMPDRFPVIGETFVCDYISHAIRLGHDVIILPRRKGDEPHVHPAIAEHQLMERVISIPRKPRSPFRWLRYQWRAVRLAKAPAAGDYSKNAVNPYLRLKNPVEVDVIHCHFGDVGIRANWLRQIGLLKGRLIVSFHGHDIQVTPTQLGRQCFADLFKNGDAFTFCSEFLMRLAIDLGAPPEKCRVLVNPIDQSCLSHLPRQSTAIASPRSSEPIRYISVGRMIECKGFDILLRAFRIVRDALPGCRLEIVGGGKLLETYRNLAHSLGIDADVEFHGVRPRAFVFDRLAEADVFVLAGVQAPNGQVEAQGVVLLEAQAAGLPVIASRIGGIPESVVDASSILVPPGDPAALADAMLRVARDSNLRASMGAAGPPHAEQLSGRHAFGTKLATLYRTVAGDL